MGHRFIFSSHCHLLVMTLNHLELCLNEFHTNDGFNYWLVSNDIFAPAGFYSRQFSEKFQLQKV